MKTLLASAVLIATFFLVGCDTKFTLVGTSITAKIVKPPPVALPEGDATLMAAVIPPEIILQAFNKFITTTNENVTRIVEACMAAGFDVEITGESGLFRWKSSTGEKE